MSPTPTGREPRDELDEEYRRLAAHDTSTPSESVRRAVHDYAARLARERGDDQAGSTGRTRWRRHPLTWSGALFGTLAAAAIAAIMIAPRFLVHVPARAPLASQVQTPPAADTHATAHAPPALVLAESAPAPPAQLAKTAPPDVRAAPPEAAAGARRSERAAATREELASIEEVTVAKQEARQPAANAERAAPAAAPPPAAADIAGAKRDYSGFVGGAPGAQTDSAANLGSGLIDAAGQGNFTGARHFLREGADVNWRDGAGRTPLLVAVLGGHADVIDLLLQSGADPNVADARGVTPLRAAEAGGRADIVATLTAHGAR
jgi:hypothetical protein